MAKVKVKQFSQAGAADSDVVVFNGTTVQWEIGPVPHPYDNTTTGLTATEMGAAIDEIWALASASSGGNGAYVVSAPITKIYSATTGLVFAGDSYVVENYVLA